MVADQVAHPAHLNARNTTLKVTVSADGRASLANTGFEATGPLLGGLAALALGGGLIVASGRGATDPRRGLPLREAVQKKGR